MEYIHYIHIYIYIYINKYIYIYILDSFLGPYLGPGPPDPFWLALLFSWNMSEIGF